ncbi:hypothetical protein BDQ17DRAFT_1434606 [Cyathus striatus]|nr:hypothetical protein BDQ17DRAFT_1434606 [Cyathus striatus]
MLPDNIDALFNSSSVPFAPTHYHPMLISTSLSPTFVSPTDTAFWNTSVYIPPQSLQVFFIHGTGASPPTSSTSSYSGLNPTSPTFIPQAQKLQTSTTITPAPSPSPVTPVPATSMMPSLTYASSPSTHIKMMQASSSLVSEHSGMPESLPSLATVSESSQSNVSTSNKKKCVRHSACMTTG